MLYSTLSCLVILTVNTQICVNIIFDSLHRPLDRQNKGNKTHWAIHRLQFSYNTSDQFTIIHLSFLFTNSVDLKVGDLKNIIKTPISIKNPWVFNEIVLKFIYFR